MEFKQIEAFVNVVKYKGFSKAAEVIYLTQPTISTHINSLEKELGVKLIERKGKESRPTKQGRAFYNYAINIINMRDRAVSAMKSARNEIGGVLDIKTSSIPGQVIVPELIAEFSRLYPNIEYNLEISDSGKVWNDILDNLGEIGFTGLCKSGELKSELIVRDPLVVITPKNEQFGKLYEESSEIALSELVREKFIWREEGSATRKTFEDYFRRKLGSDAEPETVAVINNIDTVKHCVKLGMGVSVLSAMSVDMDSEDFYVFRISDIDMEREFYMVYNKNTTLSPVAMKFRDFVLSKYSEADLY